MFDFQKEVIINDVNGLAKLTNGFRVDGMIYKNEYVKDIYKTVAEDGAPAKLTIDMGALKEKAEDHSGRILQIALECGLDRDVRSDFACNLWHFRKPFVLNFNVYELGDMDMVEKAFDHVSVVGEKIFNVSVDGTVVTLEAATNYITFRSIKVETYVCSDSCSGESMEIPVVIVNDVNADGYTTYTPNKIGFGTYEYILHNLRLPTDANWRFTSPAAVEMPVNGAKYTQYSFAYEVPRRLGGLSVAGQMNMSTTTHTFYVKSDLVADFENLLPSTAKVVTVGTKYGDEIVAEA